MTGDPPSEFGVALEMEGGVMSHPDHVLGFVALPARHALIGGHDVAEAPWSVAEWAVALRFDNPRATVLVLVLG